MNHLRKGLFTIALILVSAITFAQVSITVNVPTAGSFSAALTAAGGDANTVTNLTVAGNINATDIQFMNASMPVLAVLNLEAVHIIATSSNSADKFPDSAFKENTHLTSIILPNSITMIGMDAFYNCTGLTCNLTIPNTVISIGEYAFYNCSGLIGGLTIPTSITSIGQYGFAECKGLTNNLIIPNSVNYIGKGAFLNCIGFTGSLVIPNSITSINQWTFNGCKGLNGELTIPTSVTTIGYGAFTNCSGFKGNLLIPNSVSSIEDCAFMGCSGFDGSLTIPTSITSISNYVFSDCSGLTGNLTIPNSITSIGYNAFTNCGEFTGSLVIPNSVKSIGGGAFYGCVKLTGNLVIPNSVTTIGAYAFSQCKGFKGSITIPNSVTSLGSFAFSSCNFTGSVTIPNSITSISEAIFYQNTGLTANLTIPSSITLIDGAAFCGCTFNKIQSANLTPPAIANSSVFSNINKTTCQLIVPSGTTAAYRAANYWKDFTNITESIFVIFNSQGGTAISDLNPPNNTTISEPASPAKIGYTFGGWYKEAACTTAWNFATDLVTTNTTLYAKWIINSYAVTFNSQGGSAVAGTTANYNSTIVTPTAPTKTGYTFDGWYKESDCTNIWVFDTDVITAATTLYAKWTINVYSVTFNTQGGSVVAGATANYNTTISTPTSPTKTGYTFGGWYKEAACTNAWAFASDKVTTNTTLYAKWTINTYTVTFNPQGGSAMASVNTNYNTTIATPTAPTRTGYSFGGWYRETACTNVWTFATDKVIANATLYAKWTINVYTVNFNTQGGSAVASVNANYNTIISSPSAPTQAGYTFGGWYKEAACTNAWNFATDRVTANITLYAKWTINTYTVTFNSNGGTPVASVTAVHNAKISEPTPPTKTGYTFDGWYINLSDDFSFNFNLYMITSNLTLQAKWVPNTYYVSFYSEGFGIGSIGTEYNTTVAQPEDPIRTGYVFNGWYKEPTFITKWNFSIDKVTSNISLYAKWTAITYTVTFNSQGGSSVPSVTVNHGAKVAEPTPPVRNGYTLRGWYDQPTDGFLWFFDYSTVTQNMTLYAHWDINTYTILFDSKGGSAVSSKMAEFNSTITAPSTPTRTGYTFAGWYKDEALTSIWNFNTDVVTANATLYAKWNINTYIVSFYSNGGSNVNYIEASYNSTITRPTDPTRTGYTFAGWFKDQALTTEWNFNTDVVTNHIYLYAKWSANIYTVTFNSQGGSSIPNISTNYNNTISAPSVPTRTNYNFDGWYKESSCTNPWTFATDVVTSDITLYAKWSLASNVETTPGNSIKLYPNPAVSSLTIEGENIEEITVYSLIGSIVMEPMKNLKGSKYSFNIDDLKSGIYFAKIKTSGNKTATIKFLKQ